MKFSKAKNPTYHSKTNHIDVWYHFVRNVVEDKKVDTLKNVSDAMTKFVSTEKLSWCRETMGIGPMTKLSCAPLVKENSKW